MTTSDILRRTRTVFADVPRPAHFTNHRHCEECADHDRTLQAFDPGTIGLEQLGSPAWDPMCFVTVEGFLYYFPAMVRLVVERSGNDAYLEQFLFHVTYEGENSRFFRHLGPKQRAVVLDVLHFIREQMAERIRQWHLGGDLDGAIRLWERLASE